MMPPEPPMPQDEYNDPRVPMQFDQQSEGSLMYQLDAEEIITMIEHNLKGMVNVDGAWIIKPEQVTMNDKGVAYIISEISIRINRNTFLSNLNDETIERKLSILHKIISKNLALNYEEWDLDKNRLKSPLYRIMGAVENSFCRAKDKTTLNYFKPQLRIAETQQMMPQRKKMFGVF